MISFALVAALVAATALLIRFFVVDDKSKHGQQSLHSPGVEDQSLTSISTFMPEVLPPEWNDQLITQQIQSLQQRPPVLSHFIHSVIGRFIIGQNDKTAQKRTQLILSAINQLKATKDLQIAIDDLQIHSLEREIRFTEKEIDRNSALDRLAKQKELEALKRRKEQLELEVGIAKLEHEKRGYEERSEPEKAKAQPSREELRERKKAEIKRTDQEMAEAIFAVTKGRAFDDLSPDEQERVVRVQNYYNDRKARLDEELARI
jgi:hypothetical protein